MCVCGVCNYGLPGVTCFAQKRPENVSLNTEVLDENASRVRLEPLLPVLSIMQHDFDSIPQRLGTDSQKWQKYEGQDILPMWVADMDFRSPPAVLKALRDRVDHGIFGYARPTKSTVKAVVDALEQRYGWEIDPAWIVWLPGLVCGLNVTAQAFAEPGEEVMCLTPVYPPFMTAPKNSGRVSLTVALKLDRVARRWEIDWEAMEAAVTPNTKLFFLCNPHNPVARVFRREELVRLADFCARHDLILCSDEIHCDLILDTRLPHLPTAVAAPEHTLRTITLMAPSKTYNVPGLGTSFAVIPDAGLRAKFVRATAGIVAEVTTLGFAACEAAYRDSEDWRQDLLETLRGNVACLEAFLRLEIPEVMLEAPMEATYLAWLNVADLGLSDPVAHFEAHGIGLSDGRFFGAKPGDYVRINLGCPRETLEEGLRRMKAAVVACRS